MIDKKRERDRIRGSEKESVSVVVREKDSN